MFSTDEPDYLYEIDVDDYIAGKIQVPTIRRASTTSQAARTPHNHHRLRQRAPLGPIDEEQGLPFGTEGEDEEGNKGARGNLRGNYYLDNDRFKKDALILGMERTFFAALNNAWLMVMAGIGLMSVGNNDDRATTGGIFILASGLGLATLAYTMHVARVAMVNNNKSFWLAHSVFWASVIVGITIVALSLEIYFGTTYPYLERRAAVVVFNETKDSAT